MDGQKKWFGATLNEFAEQKARDAIQVLGKALPASVVSVDQSIVTVQFEVDQLPFTLPNVTVPIQGCEYARPPTQVGDKGLVRPADALLGGITGLGAGTPKIALPPSNLGALVWEPVSSKNWSASEDTNAYLIYGPNGFIFRDTGNNCSIVGNTTDITITAVAKITLTVTGDVVVQATGNVAVTADGDVTISGAQVSING